MVYEPSVRNLWSLGHKVVRTEVCSATSYDGTILTFFRGALLFQMRSQLHVSTCFNTRFWTFNPTIRNSSAALQVCEEATHLFILMVVYSDTSREYMSHMPHPLHAKADGQMVYTVPVIIFMDDASANISKQWNKHIVVYLSNAGLPRDVTATKCAVTSRLKGVTCSVESSLRCGC